MYSFFRTFASTKSHRVTYVTSSLWEARCTFALVSVYVCSHEIVCRSPYLAMRQVMSLGSTDGRGTTSAAPG
jgi:hypothetical protein